MVLMKCLMGLKMFSVGLPPKFYRKIDFIIFNGLTLSNSTIINFETIFDVSQCHLYSIF